MSGDEVDGIEIFGTVKVSSGSVMGATLGTRHGSVGCCASTCGGETTSGI